MVKVVSNSSFQLILASWKIFSREIAESSTTVLYLFKKFSILGSHFPYKFSALTDQHLGIINEMGSVTFNPKELQIARFPIKISFDMPIFRLDM